MTGNVHTLRPARLADIASLQAIDLAAHGEAWSSKAFADQMALETVQHLTAVDEHDAPIAHAASWIDAETLRITNVACAPDHSGQGLATGLLLALLADGNRHGLVALEVRPGNRRAQRLYSRFGFSPSGIVRGFYDRGDATGSRDALRMQVDDPAAAEWLTRLRSIEELLARTVAA